ncbi:MAG: hypothetical protein WCS28_03325 [Thiomicrospira sp.]
MTVGTITLLRNKRDEVREAIRQVNPAEYSDTTYGSESEYSIKGIIAGVEALMTDVSALTKSPNKFLQNSSYSERDQLHKNMVNLNNYIVKRDFSSTASVIDAIKPIIRGFNVRTSTERESEFIDSINELQKQSVEFTSALNEVGESKAVIKNLLIEVQELHEQLTAKQKAIQEQESQIEELLSEVEVMRDSSSSLLNTDKTRSEEISELLSDSKSHAEVIETFSKKVSQRETQLEDQAVKTDEYKKQLVDFEQEHQAHLDKAQELIESAKKALEFKTAEGLSAAFATKYSEAKEAKSGWWLAGAAVSIVTAVVIGVWIAGWSADISNGQIIGRLTLIPILLIAAWFCAGQYVKQRNIIEDYAYKTVLAKSLVGFSEQLSDNSKKGEEYSLYIQSVLSQIHNDPLGRHKKEASKNVEDFNPKNIIDSFEDLKQSIEKLIKQGNK